MRSLRRTLPAIFAYRHWRALVNMVRFADMPTRFLWRYLSGRGTYPYAVTLRTPSGLVSVTAYSFDDLITVNEVFFRRDYPILASDRIVIDIGGNIGISALYVLTHSQAHVHVVEPVPRNCERLRRHLAPFAGRWTLTEAAVLPHAHAPVVVMGVEASGRYGGVGVESDRKITVPAIGLFDLLSDVQASGKVDVLKIDVEGLEVDLLRAVEPSMAREIGRIYAETSEAGISIDGHCRRQYGSIAQYYPITPA